MIKSVQIVSADGTINLKNNIYSKHKLVINLDSLTSSSTFKIIIVFSDNIKQLRNHDYTWINVKYKWIANVFAPKILKLDCNTIVQSNITAGIWEVEQNNLNTLTWHFNDVLSSPITHYTGPTNLKEISNADFDYHFDVSPALLFSNNAIEFSRSKVPFSSIACFTDHCDFDTTSSLIHQRKFFKENHIRITKGVFLNHFSKRSDNASFEHDSEEYLRWQKDGHELAYHSLSQSIKKYPESIADFKNFIAPVHDMPTWIDHGFQPYNLSLFAKNNIDREDYSEILKKKGIQILWNYVDSGTATSGVINQLNPRNFTLKTFYKAHQNSTISKRSSVMIKNIIFHHSASKAHIDAYKQSAGKFKEVIFKRNFKAIFPAIKNILNLATPICNAIANWNSISNQVYKLSQNTPIVFKHTIGSNEFYVFQTLEMIDFRNSLSTKNIDMLINECGLFIAHTYFSVPMEYHDGRMFRTPTEIDDQVAENFRYLGDKIKNGIIWNPVLKELVTFLSNFEKIIVDVTDQGEIYLVNNVDMAYRTVR